jgi:hypothetical protein
MSLSEHSKSVFIYMVNVKPFYVGGYEAKIRQDIAVSHVN